MGIIGGFDEKLGYSNKIETLQQLEWIELDEYPFDSSVSNYATLSLEDRIILFGSSSNMKSVSQFKSGNWTEIGELESPRKSYGAIHFNGITVIVGGIGIHQTEFWNMTEQDGVLEYDGKLRDPELVDY